MNKIINHTYKSKYIKPTRMFEFTEKNSIVSFVHYKDKIMPYIEDVAYALYYDPKSRQAIIPVSDGVKGPINTCLLSYGFQLSQNTLFVTVNQRSQCEIWGRPNDQELINFVIYTLLNTTIFRCLIDPIEIDITFQIANYHRREDITE